MSKLTPRTKRIFELLASPEAPVYSKVQVLAVEHVGKYYKPEKQETGEQLQNVEEQDIVLHQYDGGDIEIQPVEPPEDIIILDISLQDDGIEVERQQLEENEEEIQQSEEKVVIQQIEIQSTEEVEDIGPLIDQEVIILDISLQDNEQELDRQQTEEDKAEIQPLEEEHNILEIPLRDDENGAETQESQEQKTNLEEQTLEEQEANPNLSYRKHLKRKRKALLVDSNDSKNKRLREMGKKYIGWERLTGVELVMKVRGKEREERKLGATCNIASRCRKSLKLGCKRITQEDREGLFTSFWSSMSWDQRKVYIASLVEKVDVKRRTTANARESRRSSTFTYSLRIQSGEKISVCKIMFLSTFGIGEWQVRNWVVESGEKGISLSQTAREETVRVSKNRAAAINTRVDIKKQFLTQYLDDLPKLPSHYARRDTSKLFLQRDNNSRHNMNDLNYLEPTFRNSMADIYREYRNKWNNFLRTNETLIIDTAPLSRYFFDDLVKEKKIAFQPLKKDMCNTCISHEVKTISEETYNQHQNRKIKARNEMAKDIASGNDGLCTVLSQDLQAVKVCPMLNASALYYKTKLCMHNFTVYDLVSHHTKCYWFDETAADLKASTFASLIIDYLTEHATDSEINEIIIWSDGCTYQNRNAILANGLLSFSVEKKVTIIQKYLEPGHTQMKCDSVHANIETRLKNQTIYLPSDYLRITEAARTPPYEVKSVEYDFVKDYSQDLAYSTIRPGKKAHDPTVTDIKAIKYLPEGKIVVKLDFDGEYIDLPVRKPKRPKKLAEFRQMFNEPIKIQKTKWQHLQELKAVLPKDCHPYYDNVPHH